MNAKLAADPENQATLEAIANAKTQIKKDEKQKLKLKKELAETTAAMVVDKQKEAERTAEAVQEEEKKRAQEGALALKKAKLAEFEEKKKEADMAVTKEFNEQLPEYVPKGAALPEDDKLAKANQKIAQLEAEEERKEEEKKKEIEEKKEEAGPNVADAAIAAAEA